MSKLEIRDLHKAYRVDGYVLNALGGVDLFVDAGEFVTVIGPSGSGKSTLFNLICGLQRPDAGYIYLDGQDVTNRTGRFAYMPQRDLLLPWRNVLDNVILGPEIAGIARSQARAEAREMLPLFGLAGFENSFPATLSGGMKQRAALLRTFLCHRDVMLLDEPFGALDALTRTELQTWLLAVWNHFRQTILFITHDVAEAVFLSDRVYVMTARPGRIQAELRIDLPRPRQRPVTTTPEFLALEARLLGWLQQAGAEV